VIQILDCEQGTPEWHQARLGVVTASEFKSVLAKGEGKMRRSYMLKLIGERMTGEPSESYSNGHMERGKEMEAEARDLYCFMTDNDVRRVGFIRHGERGASPDGLIGDDGLLELKTKLPHLQAEVLLAGKLPNEHVAQCQGALWVAGRQWLDFVSYWPKMPPFIIRVQRNEEYIANLAAEVDAFVAEMHTLLARIQPQKVAA
jgi:hypothetical protein